MNRTTSVAKAALGGLFAAGLLAAPALAQGSGSATLDAVKARGQLVCGVDGNTAGFSLPDSKGVMGGIDDDAEFAVALARLSACFEEHVSCDEAELLPLVEALSSPVALVRMGQTLEDFERAFATSRGDGPVFWPETAGDVVARGGGRN